MLDSFIMQIAKQNISKLFIRLLVGFWLIAKLVSYKAWLSNRQFPVVPITEKLENIPNIIHAILYGCSLFLLILILLKPQRKFFLILIAFELLSCFLDQNRWQPWEYQYILMALVCWVYYYNKSQAFFLCSFIIACIYVYSGLHKLNSSYTNFFWKQTILLKFFKIQTNSSNFSLLVKMGYATALLECIAGLGIMLNIFRKISAWLLIIMHVFILLVIGPFGINYNIIVWPWNIAMICFLYVLSLQQKLENFSLFKPIFPNATIFLLVGLLPILSFFNKWDYYLSSCLYSAKPPALTVKTKQPPNYFINNKVAFIKPNDSVYTIHVQTWAMKEMAVPPYPEKRVLEKIKVYCKTTFNFKDEEFYWRELDK